MPKPSEAIELAETERDVWREKTRIMTMKRDAVRRASRDVCRQRNDAVARGEEDRFEFRDIRAVLHEHHDERAGDLWVDDVLGDAAGSAPSGGSSSS